MIVLSYILMIAAVLGLACELRRDLMMLQQNSYFNNRYLNWLSESGDTTSARRIVGMAVLLFSLSALADIRICLGLIGLFGALTMLKLSWAEYKKPLVWTARAKRIYAVAALLCVMVIAAAVILFGHDWGFLRIYYAAVAATLCYCASHVVLLAANCLLRPIEKRINKKYIDDAADRLRSMPDLKIIGVTGSYGKTSTKHFLHRILSEQFDTLMTPGSYNTTLGVVRTVREMLKPYNEVFIVEMGAKQSGDIREICDLVHPTVGIVTAVGPQHLESFGSIQAVQATKFELVDALPSDGIAFVNNDFEYVANRTVDNVRCERYSCAGAPGAGWRAEDIVYGADGTKFKVSGPGAYNIELHTRLLGEANISDLLAAVAVAHEMGVTDERIRYAVAQIEPVEHRLSVKRTAGGITIIDDAYNSNPVGSRMAMEVLGSMPGGKRIVITPGMIELGERQHELNAELGRHIARHTDVAIIVGRYNRDAIMQGIEEVAEPRFEKYAVGSFAEAQALMQSMVSAGDIVLYENDLPDTFK